MGMEHWIKIRHFSAYCILRWNWFFLKITDISIQAAVGVSCKWSQGAAFPSTSIHTLKESKLFWTSVFFFCVSNIFYPHLKRIYSFQDFCFFLFGFLEFSIRTLKESKLFPTVFFYCVFKILYQHFICISLLIFCLNPFSLEGGRSAPTSHVRYGPF